MSGIEAALRSEFPEATEAEVRRFVRSCQDGKKDEDAVKAQAEKLLEDYLDWRSCFGLDYHKHDDINESFAANSDTEDWKFAINKALEVEASMRRAKTLKLKLAEAAAKKEEADSAPVNYDIEFSDSQKSEGNDKKEEDSEEKVEKVPNEEPDNHEELKTLAQMIFQQNDMNGHPIKDKNGFTILHVLPGLINRRVAPAEFYALTLSFYFDRKFDRATEEKMTVIIDVRAGEGWPNPMAVMMVKFVHTIVRTLHPRYPERLQSLIIFPVPRAAIGIWAAMKVAFRSDLMNKTTLLPGPADRAAPLPKEQLKAFIDEPVLDLTEQLRLDHFKPIFGTISSEI